MHHGVIGIKEHMQKMKRKDVQYEKEKKRVMFIGCTACIPVWIELHYTELLTPVDGYLRIRLSDRSLALLCKFYEGGDITPCSMFHQRIANIYEDKDLEATYTSSEIIHNLLDRNYKGKCGACDKEYVCGGCRVRAEYFYGDYLQEDKLCWL